MAQCACPVCSPTIAMSSILTVVHHSEPQADEILVKVVATDSNPKDWKVGMICQIDRLNKPQTYALIRLPWARRSCPRLRRR
jgi:hypothetical protein